MIYFDNAATGGKKPLTVINAVDKSLREYCANAGRSGHSRSEKAALAIYSAREKVADFFHADGAEQVIFTPNCTAAINYVIKGVLNKGDHIIVSSLEHNAVMRPLIKSGIEYDIAEVATDGGKTLENFKSLIRKNTKMIFCTAASNVTGKILPIYEIGQLASKNGILFGVDAAQAAGIIDINMKKMNIDYLCVAPHKALYAPMGIGLLIARSPIEKTVIEGGTGNNSENLVQGNLMPEDFESGTLNISGILGLSAGIDFVKKYGIKNIYNHEIKLMKRLYNELLKIDNIILYNDFKEGDYMPLISFNLKGLESGEVAAELNKYGIAVRAGLHCAPLAHKSIGTLKIGTVRVSPSVFNRTQEVDYLIRAIKNIKKM